MRRGGQRERPAHFGVRTREHKLIYYDGLKDSPPDERWEFYDLSADPGETRNAVDDARHSNTVAGLKTRLRRMKEDLGDTEASLSLR